MLCFITFYFSVHANWFHKKKNENLQKPLEKHISTFEERNEYVRVYTKYSVDYLFFLAKSEASFDKNHSFVYNI